MVHPMRSSRSMWEPTWVSISRCWLLPESRLGHDYVSPKPVGSTHLRFGDANHDWGDSSYDLENLFKPHDEYNSDNNV